MAGLDLDDLPIGFWSMISISLILSRSPPIEPNEPSSSNFLSRRLAIAGYSMFLTRVDFPEPLTPVTTTRHCNGIFKLIFLRLFSLQSESFM